MRYFILIIIVIISPVYAYGDLKHTIEFDSSGFSFSVENEHDVITYGECQHCK